VMLPKRLYAALQKETTLWLETDMASRIKVIAEDYDVEHLPPEAVTGALDALVPRLGHEQVRQLHQFLERRDWEPLIEKLMLQYYDPLYAHTKPVTRIDIKVNPFAPKHPSLLRAINTLTEKESPLSE